MQKIDAQEILRKYREGRATPIEKVLLEDWLLFGEFEAPGLTAAELRKELELTSKGLPLYRERRFITWPHIAAAAVVVFCLSLGLYLSIHRSPVQQMAYLRQHDAAPGRNQATLTLANGHQLLLNRSLRGRLALQNGTSISVSNDRQLSYIGNGNRASTVEYNTLSTARGEQAPFPLVLTDGTKVWLNAASSITFPVAFKGDERKVSITGEAYFEVVHNADKPFRVTVNNQTIEDIGTHFNINAYNDEPTIKTTLFEGSIAIDRSGNKAVLKPGQQANTEPGSNAIRVTDIDTESALAWKNGYFLFDHESLQSVMRKISRWYNVEISYPPGQKLDVNYLGSMPRDSNLSVVLNMLQVTGDVQFKIEGKKITPYKKYRSKIL